MGSFQSCGGATPNNKMLTLKYFAISGRAEPIRLTLTLGQVKFHDMRIPGSEWEAKHKSLMPYGQLPVLVVDQKPIAQTKAILRYVGKLVVWKNGNCLYPKDPFLAAKVDEIIDAFDDLWLVLSPTMKIADQETKEEARRKLFAPGGAARALLDIFEKALNASVSGYIVPQAHLTIADIMLFCTLNTFRSGFLEGLGPDLYKDHSKIMEHKHKIASIPLVKKYYETPRPFYEVFQVDK